MYALLLFSTIHALSNGNIDEDYCDQCTKDWASGIKHIDIWTGENNVNGGQAQIKCEEALTPDETITYIRNPAKTYAADKTLLYRKVCGFS